MSSSPSHPGHADVSQYLVQAHEPQTLASLVPLLEADPQAQIVNKIGPPGQPHTLVVRLSQQQADALQQKYPGELIVERDQPLSLIQPFNP